MKLNDLKHLINETIQEMHTEESLLTGLDNIITWASNAKRQLNNKNDPQIFYRLIKAINDKSSEIITFSTGRHDDDDDIEEGYGTGLGDEKAAHKGARWTVHYPSDEDWKKHKKSLDAVYEGVKLDKHEKDELKLYKGMEMILKKLIKLHSKSHYDEKEEENLQKGLKKSLKELDKLEKSEPKHE
jgi:hypothetical protein